MKRFILAALLLAGCTGGGGGPAATPTAAAGGPVAKGSGTIVAGKSVDALTLGESKADVEKAMGGLGEQDVNEFNKAQSYAIYKDKGLELVFDKDKLGMIVCHNDEDFTPYTGATAEGLWVGSSKDDVKKALGPPKEDPGQALDYAAQGIWFTFSPEGKVETIRISQPR